MSTADFLNQDFGDDSEEDFNPEPERNSDDEGDAKPDTNGDDEDDEPAQQSRGGRDNRDGNDDVKDEAEDNEGEDEEEGGEEEEEDEEDDEEDDEEEEDDDVEGQPSRKRRRKQRRNQFIDVEAEVDEEDEEEPEEDEDLPGEEMHPDDLQELPPGADRDDRKHRELDRQRDMQMHIDAEEEAARLKERYGRQGRAGGGGAAIIDQRLLMPTIDDPRIWRLKCRPGKEHEIVVNITHRIFERATTRDPLRIISAFFREGAMSGNLYVEARRQEDIVPALENITHIFFGTKPMMLPLEEMPDLLRIKKTKQLEPGMYVRIKRGLYAGDLGQIDEVEANNVNMTVKLVPRLDYGLTEDANAAPGLDGNKRKRPVTTRPPPKLFSEAEARKRHSRYLSRVQGLSNNNFNYQGKEYINGFLVDTFKINNLQTEDVNPTLEEVTKFTAKAKLRCKWMT